MARSIYPTLLGCSLLLAAMICLHPGAAGDLLSLVSVVRGQVPPSDPNPPGGYPQGNLPYSPGRYPLPFPAPGAPTQPMQPSYPNWNGPANNPQSQAPAQPPPGSKQPETLPDALMIATVGPEAILASETGGRYAAYVEAQASGASPNELAKLREELIAQLKGMVETKLLVIDAVKVIPVDAQKDIQQQIDAEFDKSQLKDLMDRTKTKTTAELDAKLREYGTSLERRRHLYFEQYLAHSWLQQQSKKDGDDDIAFTAMLDYYQRHLRDYDYPAKSRWEELMVRFDKFNSKGEAYQALCDMGNQVLHGANFAEVAKAHSQGPTADQGGQRDWTNRGALRSAVLDEAIFGLPVLQMSQILEDEFGFHIVRVVERKDAGRTSFPDAQPEIKKKLKDDIAKRRSEEFLDKLRNKTQVWTILDTPAGSALAPPPATAANGNAALR